MSATSFTPQRHGFHFPNAFTTTVVTIPGFGPISTSGLCGGMSFSALDYYLAGRPVPTHQAGDFPGGASVPPQADRLAQYILDRQLSSFNPLVNPSVVKFVTQAAPFGRSAYQVTVQDEWPLIKNQIDAGSPCAIGLIADSLNPTQSHQVVAIAYDDSAARVLWIYDCNYPDTTVTLTFDDGAERLAESTGDSWIGLFLEGYASNAPTYTDIVLGSGIDTNPSTPSTVVLGDVLEVGFRVRNLGDYPAHIASLDALMRGPANEDLDSSVPPDGVAATIAAGGEQPYLASVSPFGTTSGTYELVPYYQSPAGEWFVVPADLPGTRSTVTVDAV
jgi:hypothetical protein